MSNFIVAETEEGTVAIALAHIVRVIKSKQNNTYIFTVDGGKTALTKEHAKRFHDEFDKLLPYNPD